MTIHTDGKPTVSNAPEKKRVLPEGQTSVVLPHAMAKLILQAAQRAHGRMTPDEYEAVRQLEDLLGL